MPTQCGSRVTALMINEERILGAPFPIRSAIRRWYKASELLFQSLAGIKRELGCRGFASKSYRGFAARCEARLCLAVALKKGTWALPLVRPMAQKGQARTMGTAPGYYSQRDGEAKPRLTSGGKAAVRLLRQSRVKKILIVTCRFDDDRMGGSRPWRVPQAMAAAYVAGGFNPKRCEIRLYSERLTFYEVAQSGAGARNLVASRCFNAL
jgi:hypothetical protein